MTEAVVAQALEAWGLKGARVALVAERENTVFRVDGGGQVLALRLRRAGYRSDAEILSELDWLHWLAEQGLSVPRPVPSSAGRLVEVIDGRRVDMAAWLTGTPLGASGQPLALADPAVTFHALGQTMARLHTESDRFTLPPGFSRCRWDRAGLVGDAPVWGRFWENPVIAPDLRARLAKFRHRADAALQELNGRLDQGLIHADLVRENVLQHAGGLALIDFDDAGFGYRLFDIATALIKNLAEPAYPQIEAALIAGYRSLRPLDTGPLPLFLALRAVTYLGWIVPRLDERGNHARCTRFAAQAENLVAVWMGN